MHNEDTHLDVSLSIDQAFAAGLVLLVAVLHHDNGY